MGVSTNGIIAFGIDLGADEETEFPWAEQEDFEDWWTAASGFSHPEPKWGGDGPDIAEYFAAKKLWLKEHPCPVEHVIHCSYDYPMSILAVPGTVTENTRGNPEKIELATVSADAIAALKRFCADHKIETDSEPCWLLASLWG